MHWRHPVRTAPRSGDPTGKRLGGVGSHLVQSAVPVYQGQPAWQHEGQLDPDEIYDSDSPKILSNLIGQHRVPVIEGHREAVGKSTVDQGQRTKLLSIGCWVVGKLAQDRSKLELESDRGIPLLVKEAGGVVEPVWRRHTRRG